MVSIGCIEGDDCLRDPTREGTPWSSPRSDRGELVLPCPPAPCSCVHTSMSPIIKFHNETAPPPFSSSRRQQPLTRPNAFDPSPSARAEEAEEGEDEVDGHPYPPSYPDQPATSSQPKSKPRREDGYDEYDERQEDEGAGLLGYEMDVLGGSGSRTRGVAPETLAGRRARGEASIGGDQPGWFGVTRPTRAAWREIREMMYEVSQPGRFTG